MSGFESPPQMQIDGLLCREKTSIEEIVSKLPDESVANETARGFVNTHDCIIVNGFRAYVIFRGKAIETTQGKMVMVGLNVNPNGEAEVWAIINENQLPRRPQNEAQNIKSKHLTTVRNRMKRLYTP